MSALQTKLDEMREYIEEHFDGCECSCCWDRDGSNVKQLLDALEVVLERHSMDVSNRPECPGVFCHRCLVKWPCPPVEAISRALGVEVEQ